MTRSRTLARRAAAVASAFVVGVSVMGPATADAVSSDASGDSEALRADPAPNRVFRDSVGGSTRHGIDIDRVAVWNRRGSPYFKVTLSSPNFVPARAQVAEYFLNVRRRHDGPEFLVRSYSSKDAHPRNGTYVFTTRRNKPWQVGSRLRCPNAVGRFKVGGADQIRMAVPKRCVGGPHAISVGARVWELRPGDRRDYYDAAPGYKQTYAWVKPRG